MNSNVENAMFNSKFMDVIRGLQTDTSDCICSQFTHTHAV